MKTKHLFFAAALPLAFAACTNDEFETMNGQTAIGNDQRPLVEVKLNFQKEGADTRVDYDGSGFTWNTEDEIGAFLMDEIASSNRPFGATAETWEKETWLQHYKLVDYIHTDYPFSWSTSENAWVAPSKLQEGNYFFAAPYESYDGERQLIHRLDGQEQTGGTVADMNAAIAKNQYFLGYGQVKAGANNVEVMKDLMMTQVLAPVKVTLRNIGSLPKDVEKVIIYGEQVATSITVDPTNAAYYGTNDDGTMKPYNGSSYNLDNNNLNNWTTYQKVYFNYANYLGFNNPKNENYEDYREDVYEKGSNPTVVYNIASGATDYKQGDALRQIVHPSYSTQSAASAPAYEKRAVLSFKSPVTVKEAGGEIHFAIMVNTIPSVKEYSNSTGGLFMEIITTQGEIKNIDLTHIKVDETVQVGTDKLDPNTVLLNNKITSLKPATKNELIIQFDNNSVSKTQNKDVQDSEELLAFINWNSENVRVNTANLLKDVEFTKEMYDALDAKDYKGKLAITAENNAKLLVADNVNIEVLNKLDLDGTTATIVLGGERTLTSTIAAALNDNNTNDKDMVIENRGTLAINSDVTSYVELNNYGTINISEDGKLRGTVKDNITNYGTVNNKGEFYNLHNSVDKDEEAMGWVNTGKVNHFASNAADATIQLTTINDKLSGSTATGTIYFESVSGTLLVSKLNEQKVTKLKVTGGTIDFNNVDNATVKELTIDGNVTLAGWVNYGLSTVKSAYHEFEGVEKASINKAVTFINVGVPSGKVVFEKECAVTFAKDEKATTAKSDFENVTFINGATVNVAEDVFVTMHTIDWNGNDVTNLGTFYVDDKTLDTDYTVISGKDLVNTPDAINYTYITVNASVTYATSGRDMNFQPEDDNNDGKADAIWTITELDDWKTLANLSSKTFTTGANTATVYTYVIKDITIQKTLDGTTFFEQSYMDNNETKYYRDDFKKVVAGKKVTLDNVSLTQCNSSYDISMGELYVKGDAVTIGSGDAANIKTFLNVTKFDYSGMNASSTLTINNGYIQVAGSAQVNGKNGVGVTNSINAIQGTNGKLVITKLGSSGELLEWDFATSAQKWVDFK